MSSNTKDPLEKQDTSTESDESEKELEKAEGNLEHLKIEAAKDDSDESKAVESPNQEGPSSSSGDLFNKIYAEQREIQKPHPKCSSDPEFKVTCLTDPSKEKELEAKGTNENIGTKLVEGESHKMGKKDLEATASENFPIRMEERESQETSKKDVDPTTNENFPQRLVEGDADSARSTPPICQAQEISPAAGPSRPIADHDAALAEANRLRRRSPQQGSSSRGFDYDTTDSGDTSADVSEIHSEIADCSRKGSVPLDALETIEKKESPNYASAVERRSPDNSDTDISEIQDFVPPPPPKNSSLLQGIAPPPTPESPGALQDYLPPLPTPESAIGSTSNPSVTPESEPMEDEPVSGDQRMQVCDKPLKQEQQNEENKEEMNVPEDARKRTSESILLVQKSVKVQDVEEGSPSKRRRASKEVSDSSAEEKGIAERPRSGVKQDAEKKYKKVTSIPSDLKSTSESPEPKSSSSDELHGMEFTESKSMSEFQGPSNAEKGLLPSTQQTKMSSKDSVMAKEEEDQTSAIREQGLRTVETKDTTLVKMETSGGEGTAELAELSRTKPSTSRAYESEGTLKEHEPSIGAFEYEESVDMSEQETKLKKGDSVLMPSHRTRHDSGDPDMRGGLGDLQQSGSTSPTDISDIPSISPSEEETGV